MVWFARPEIFEVGRRRRPLTMLALPACYIADLLEAHWLLGIKHFPAKFPDITFLVPRDQLDNHEQEFPRRTQAGLLEVMVPCMVSCPDITKSICVIVWGR